MIKLNKRAFTMAEVLVVLGIVGIVASVTIPNWVTKYQKYVTEIKLKKVYTEIVQAVKLSEIDNGELMSWDFPRDGYSLPKTIAFVEKYYQPYFYNIHGNLLRNLYNYFFD